MFVFVCYSVSQLSEEKDKTLASLSRTVEYKELKGKDPSNVELVRKIEKVNNNQISRSKCASNEFGSYVLDFVLFPFKKII